MFLRCLFVSVFLIAPGSAVPAQEVSLSFFRALNDPNGNVFRSEGNGIRIKAMGLGPFEMLQTFRAVKQIPYHWILDSKTSLGGDFDIAADFKIHQLGLSSGHLPGVGNTEISLIGEHGQSVYGISIHADPRTIRAFRVARMEMSPQGMHPQFLIFPRLANEGRMSIRRERAEVVFLVADGLDAEWKELVRFPYEKSLYPDLRISAWQGPQLVRTPVDVSLSRITVKAEKLLDVHGSREVPVSQSRSTMYPYTLELAKTPGKSVLQWQGNDSVQTFSADEQGVRVKTPVGTRYVKEAPGYWYREPEWSLEGDFEVAASYKFNQMEPAGPEGFQSVNLGLGIESYGPLGSFTLGCGVSKWNGPEFSLSRHSQTSQGPAWDMHNLKTRATEGKLIVRRVGERVFFLVEEEGSTPKELFHCPAIDSPALKVRLSANLGANNTSVLDLLLTELTVKAQRLSINGKPLAVTRSASTIRTDDPADELVAPPDSKRWLFYILGCGVLVALIVIVILLFRSRI